MTPIEEAALALYEADDALRAAESAWREAFCRITCSEYFDTIRARDRMELAEERLLKTVREARPRP